MSATKSQIWPGATGDWSQGTGPLPAALRAGLRPGQPRRERIGERCIYAAMRDGMRFRQLVNVAVMGPSNFWN